MAILASKDLRTPKKSYLQWGSTWCKGLLLVYESNNQTNWATEAFACKTETLGSLCSHALLILTKWSKSKNKVVHGQKFKDLPSSKYLSGSVGLVVGLINQ